MKNKLIVALIGALTVLALITACSRDGVRANEKDYEVVEEGTATGVTSTIAGPGETLPPITNTNADTTTAFAFDPNAVPPANTTQQPGTIAGTLPPVSATYPPPRPIAQPRPPVTQTAKPEPIEPPPTTTTVEPAPEQPKEDENEPEEPPPTDTATTTTTTTAPPPPPPAS